MSLKRLILINLEARRDATAIDHQFQLDLSTMPDSSSDRDIILKFLSQQPECALHPSEEIRLLFESKDFPGAFLSLPDSVTHGTVVRARIKQLPVAAGLSSRGSGLSDLSFSGLDTLGNLSALVGDSNGPLHSTSLDSSPASVSSKVTNIHAGPGMETESSPPSTSCASGSHSPPASVSSKVTKGPGMETESSPPSTSCASGSHSPPASVSSKVTNFQAGPGMETESSSPSTSSSSGLDSPHDSASSIRSNTQEDLGMETESAATSTSSSSAPATKRRKTSTGVERTEDSRRLPLAGFQWKKYFTADINKKLEKLQELTSTEENQISRDLCKDIIQINDCPSATSLRAFIAAMLKQYPGLVGKSLGSAEADEEKLVAIKAMWFERMGKHLSRNRSKNGRQLPYGRPKRTEKTDDDAQRSQPSFSGEQIDWNSYKKNVELLVTNHNDIANHPSLASLFEVTFKGRRSIIADGNYENVFGFITSDCPLLAYSDFLLKEFDVMIPGVVQKIKENWKGLIPKIISQAELQRSSKNIQEVLKDRATLTNETIALRLLLPLLHGMKPSKAIDYFLQIIGENENITKSAEQIPTRLAPFMIKCGNTFHIIIEKKPVVKLGGDAIEAFVCLIAAFFVFDLSWTNEVLPLYGFVEKCLLEQEMSVPELCANKVKKLVRLLNNQ